MGALAFNRRRKMLFVTIACLLVAALVPVGQEALSLDRWKLLDNLRRSPAALALARQVRDMTGEQADLLLAVDGILANTPFHLIPIDGQPWGRVQVMGRLPALALLRTAQESLVNAAKHGDGQAAGINLSFENSQTTLTVASPLSGEHTPAKVEAGAKAGASGKAGASAEARGGAEIGALKSPMETADGGYGLMGLRERLLLLGGTLTAGPRDGQWIVTAQVPR